MAKTQSKKQGKQGGGINKIYLGILKDFEQEKEKVLKNYVEKVAKIKKEGIKKIETKMNKAEEKAVEKLLDEI